MGCNLPSIAAAVAQSTHLRHCLGRRCFNISARSHRARLYMALPMSQGVAWVDWATTRHGLLSSRKIYTCPREPSVPPLPLITVAKRKCSGPTYRRGGHTVNFLTPLSFTVMERTTGTKHNSTKESCHPRLPTCSYTYAPPPPPPSLAAAASTCACEPRP